MDTMKRMLKNSTATIGTVLVLCLVACATTQTPQELTDARSAYQRVQTQSNSSTRFKPDKVRAAKVALDMAEASFLDSPSSQETRDLASTARKKAELAEGSGLIEADVAKAEVGKDAK